VLDGMVHTHMRSWVELPVSSCIGEVACLPAKMCGLDILSIRSYATNLKLTVRAILKLSANSDIRQLFPKETSVKNVEVDSTLNDPPALSSAKKVLRLRLHESALAHIGALVLQGDSITSVINNIPKKNNYCLESHNHFHVGRSVLLCEESLHSTNSNLCR